MIYFSVMDYFDGGGLNLKINDDKIKLNWKQKLNFAKDIASALSFLHSNGLVHKDLRPENLMLKSENDWNIICKYF